MSTRSTEATSDGVEPLRLLSDLARELAAATGDYDAVLSLVARRLGETFGDLCVIRLIGADGRHLEWGSAIHHPDPSTAALMREGTAAPPQRVGEGITGRVAATGEPVFLPVVDVAMVLADLDPERRTGIERLRITSLIAVPLLSRGRVIGVVNLTRSDPARPYREEDVRFLTDVAAHASLAIVNSRSYAAERAALAAALQASQEIYESEEAHRLLFEASPLPLFVFDITTMMPLAVNEAGLRLYGYTHDEFMARDVGELAADGHDSARQRLATLGDAEVTGTARHRRKDGSLFRLEYRSRALTFSGRRARMTVINDTTDRYEAERTRALLAAIVQSSNDAIISRDLDGRVTSWNAAAERLFGHSAAEAVTAAIALIIPEDRMDEERMLLARIAAGDRIWQHETVRVRKDGATIAVSLSLAPVLDATGKVVGVSTIARDLTAQRKAEQTLRHTEEQLRQAQKMEAVGRLAGGIAHDFNNVLSVILSYCAILSEDLAPDDVKRGDIGEIGKAATRAADLTRQLLLFSRQQVIEPRVLDLNEVLLGMDKMLKRIIGEDIDLVSGLATRPGRIRADASSVEQVIMNLVVNARDAMPTGGKLTIETGNVFLDLEYARQHLGSSPGPHVMLAVTDTGVGMDRATQERIFEPFFTTKGAGKGTGLGLSTVFGIAQQSGGSVWVYSEPGKGSTFKVYFPRVEARAEAGLTSRPPVLRRGTETILLVEDQEQVRTVARGILERNGYHVVVATNGADALRAADEHTGVVHLVVTDVVMPQMSGAELAKRIAERRPETKVLFMSGYTDDSIVRHGVLESGLAFVQKPFTPELLARKVRQALDAPPEPGTGTAA